MDGLKKHWRWVVLSLLLVSCLLIWHAVYSETPGQLKIAFLNVGQGDAIFIETPSHHRILIDAGPDASAMKELSKQVPWYVHTLDVAMISSPSIGYFEGFLDIIKQDHIDTLIQSDVQPSVIKSLNIYKQLQQALKDQNTKVINARRGLEVLFGDGVVLSVIFPESNNLKLTDASIVAELQYGSTTVMLTGASSKNVQNYLAQKLASLQQNILLKVSQHGSKTALSESFIKAINPSFAIISAGDPKRSHDPDQEVLETFLHLHIPVLITFREGTIVFESDGRTFKRK